MNLRNLLPAATLAAALATVAAAAAAPAPTLAVTAHWPGPDGGWDFSAFDAAHHRLYIARSNGVTAVDVASGKATPLLAAQRTHSAVPVNGGAEVLVTEGGTGRALLANAQTGEIRAAIAVGKKPDAAIVEPTTGLALVMDNDGGGVTLIDTHAGKAVGAIATPGALESPATDGAGRVFVNVEDLAEIAVLDMKRRAAVAHWKLDGCEAPSGLAYAPKARLLVSACANKVAKVVSADTGQVVATLAIGGRPDWAGYDARTGTVLIPSADEGVVQVVSVAAGATPAVVAKAPTHPGSRSGAVDEATGRLYVPSADFAPSANGRRQPKPGSFQVLVLSPTR
jgi:DNA-binding beta-propeller fold protein YncE